MLIYGVSGIFAHKETIKQFLQPIIEQVFGERGWMCREDVLPFASVFQSYCIFCVGFFNSPMLSLGKCYQYLHILCAFHQKVKQCFGHKVFVMYN